jgi:RNA polymerase sigma-70 factor (ECF subfamily)
MESTQAPVTLLTDDRTPADGLSNGMWCRCPRLVGALALHCGDRGTAEELAQEALARAWQRWTQVQQMQNPSAWIYRVAFNLATSWFRRRAAETRAR